MGTAQAFGHQEILAAADAIRSQTRLRPSVGLILGSGLNALADAVGDALRIPYSDVPHFPRTGVAGHSGLLVLGQLNGRAVMIMQGRSHPYEGLPLQQITLPVRVMHELGANTLIVTNAAGGVNPSFRAGDLMLITDHLGLMAMTGGNPLWGPNDEALGPRFPAMSQAYDRELRDLALQVAGNLGISLRQGVYAGLSGPMFETPAEVRYLQLIGADATGMSTVPEVIVARHAGMRVLGFSGISNVAVSDPDAIEAASHEEVLEAGRSIGPKLLALIRGVLAALPSDRA